MSAKHTKGPWKAHPIQYGGLPYAPVTAKTLLAKVYSEAFGDHDECEANARRIVACVNACEGFSIEELEGANLFKDSIDSANLINDLLATLKSIVSEWGYDGHGGELEDGESEVIDKARAAIAKATAQQ